MQKRVAVPRPAAQKAANRLLVARLSAAVMAVNAALFFIAAPANVNGSAGLAMLFALGGFTSLSAAAGILARQDWGWWMGVIMACGGLILFMITWLVGLPGIGVGVVAVFFAFIALMTRRNG